MSVMTLTEPELSAQETSVLKYYTREALGIANTDDPLAGLKLGAFRKNRDALVRSGVLTKTANGRFRPTAMEEGA